MKRNLINVLMAALLAAAPAAAGPSQRTGSTRGAEPAGGSGGGAVSRGGSDTGGPSGGAMPRSEPAPRAGSGSDRRGASDDSSAYEGRDGRTAGARTSARPHRGGGVVYVPGGYGFYPWGFGGLGFGAYYGGYDDPWDYDAGYAAYGGRYGAYQSDDSGAMRLVVKPRDAQVYVDGYYAGVVDDFDGIFQRLHLEPGPHRVEVRAPGYATLSLDVQITPGQTIKYEGDLAPAP